MNDTARAKLDANMTKNRKTMESRIWYQNAARATHVALGQKVPYDEAVDAGFNYATGIADAREAMVEQIRQQARERPHPSPEVLEYRQIEQEYMADRANQYMQDELAYHTMEYTL